MKLKIKKNLLMNSLNDVSKALSSKNIIPILSGIKFDLFKDRLVLTASDNDITIQTSINSGEDLEIINTGSIVIKGKYVLDIIRKLEQEYINLEIVDDHKVLIYASNSEFNLNGIDSKEYPLVDLNLSSEPISIKIKDFKDIIAKTNYASSLDEARMVLTGVNLCINDDYLECSATDSYRLALKKIKLNEKFDKDINIVIPSRNLGELYKILPEDEDSPINIHIYSNKVIFEFNDILFQTRLINNPYPNTKNLIPKESLFELILNKREFYNMVDRASILNNDRDNNIITLEIGNNLLKITSMSLEVGKVEEKMDIKCDEKIKISFSSRYMMDALKTISSDNFKIVFVGEVKPILLKEEDNDDMIALILPIRTY